MTGRLPLNLNAHYQEILSQTKTHLTNKDKTGILDNTQRADQDQEQVGQLTFLVIGILKLNDKIEKLTNTVEALEQNSKTKPIFTGTTSSAQPAAQIGNTFQTYNPPDK